MSADFVKQGEGDARMLSERLPVVGRHLIIDIFEAKRTDDYDLMEALLIDCVKITGATLIDLKIHEFDANGGLTGIAILAESHISFHSWPEYNFIAVDLFMCGEANPCLAIPILKTYLETDNVRLGDYERGGTKDQAVDSFRSRNTKE